jgi:glutathione reductase (NADPH)
MRTDYSGLPSIVFTIPSLVSVGMQEKEAKDHGLRFKSSMKIPLAGHHLGE